MYIALLGRQPELSIAELERVFGDVRWFSNQSALINTEQPVDVQQLGGTQKIGTVVLDIPHTQWQKVSNEIVHYYMRHWSQFDGKITLGISTYGFDHSIRDVQKTGLSLKSKLKQQGVSLRLVPNQEPALSTASSHHNKLGLSPNKVELLVIKGSKSTIIAESRGAQNITALASRDQGRPRRDAFVGMLPPKLALLMLNLSGLQPNETQPQHILDPFCGTGVVLQEALLRGFDAYGTDLAEKMIRYSEDNLTWLKNTYHLERSWTLAEGDAMDTVWETPIDAVVSEAYLGQPFSAPPSSAKLTEVRGNCNHIIGSFLKNISKQLESGTPLVLAVPAWRSTSGTFTHLPLTESLDTYGFEAVTLKTVDSRSLLYFRPDQVVARELLILTKK